MIRVPNDSISKYAYMFEPYDHNIAVIYASLEGQYNSVLYVNHLDNPDYAILFTPFDFHYVAGNPDAADIAEQLRITLFDEYIPQYDKQEAVVFSSTNAWYAVLDKVFDGKSQLKDKRYVFRLNNDKFTNMKKAVTVPDDCAVHVTYEREFNSSIPYPVARLYIDDVCVSHCSGFMLGKGHAEIDVGTDEQHQNKGYATVAAVALITELLNKGITPDWCTWPYREASRALAKRLGFEEAASPLAYIWVK